MTRTHQTSDLGSLARSLGGELLVRVWWLSSISFHGRLITHLFAGRVRIARHANTGQQAAVKIIPMQAIANSRMSIREIDVKQDKMKLGIEREIIIMKLIEHPNLLGLWDVYETSREL